MDDRNAIIQGPYEQPSIRARLEAFFHDDLGKVATDPKTGRVPENWHQRLSELRTDKGYTIFSWRNRDDLKVSEYMMPNGEVRHPSARDRTRQRGCKCWLNQITGVHGRKVVSRAAYGKETLTPSVAEPSG